MPFYNTVHNAIRSIDDDKIVFYEPLTYDVWPVGFDSIPVGGEDYATKSAMSYHIYCPLAGGNTTPMELKIACQVIDWDFFHQRVHDIKRIGGGGEQSGCDAGARIARREERSDEALRIPRRGAPRSEATS